MVPRRGAETDQGQPLIEHLVELRTRLLRCIAAVAIMFLPLYLVANDIYALVSAPLRAHLAEGTSMIATEVASPFLTPFKLALVLSVFLTIPYSLHQLWSFVAPGLYNRERRIAMPILVSSVLLFYAGIAFAYFAVFPLIFAFFPSVAPEGVMIMTDISHYLDFVLKLFFAFGLAFEIPIAILVLVWTGAVSIETLAARRAYVIVGCFVAGMLLTPPDIISQVLLALPMWLLFEAGMLFSRLLAGPLKPPEETSPGHH